MSYIYFYDTKPWLKSYNNSKYPIILLGKYPIKI